MAEIVFETRSARITLPLAELSTPDAATLLDAVRHVGLPLGQSCRGEGVCRSCAVEILAGIDGLTAPSPLERRFGFGFVDDRRLACQIQLTAADAALRVVIGHPAWGRLTATQGEPPGPVADVSVDPLSRGQRQ
nr:2Fe-2S iron-sulfur cluster-binding protein [Nannocystis sp.]